MQILLVGGLKIVLFTSKQAHSYKFYECSQVLCWQTTPLTDTRPQNPLVWILLLSFSSKPFTGDAANEFITNDSWYRGSE